VRHEQGAGHMAEGYAHATGRPGVAMVTSGPAATNIVTPLCDAYLDSVPLVVITGQVPLSAIGAGTSGLPGLIVVWLGIVGVNVAQAARVQPGLFSGGRRSARDDD